ncbi:MAG: hypothetical protein HQL05_07295 [Nitrospirae bacterium]|uniref:hypothetical protein n=1 Tax=Candidatus Magnetobacterium casense TaxID=1455061 RepID=UPI00058B3B1E|nr:hypothetical protein [Candidatus Magnetobacterium casensis]MBF0337625.1 hypothetical protein [Nitrospirota bacterium]
MVTLELTDDEARALGKILQSYLSDLRMEICGTEQMDFRRGLKGTESFIKDVLKRLNMETLLACNY